MFSELCELIEALGVSSRTIMVFMLAYLAWQCFQMLRNVDDLEDGWVLLFGESCLAQVLAVYLALLYSVAVFKKFEGIAAVVSVSVAILVVVQNRRNHGEIYSFRTLSGALLYMTIVGWHWIWLVWYAICYAYHDYYERNAGNDDEQWGSYERKVDCMISLVETLVAAMILKYLMPLNIGEVVALNTSVIIVFYLILPVCNVWIRDFLIYNILP